MIEMFSSHGLIEFYKRVLDDIFLIVDIADINNLEEWIGNILKHRYLKFTYEFSEESINFLDVNVKIHNNGIQTDLYTKPMSRHLYLHSSSNHPVHLKNSLYYSQGLRIVKICSEYSTRLRNLISLFEKFKNRWYLEKTLYNTFLRLMYTKRDDVLRPKNNLLISYLKENNPEIVCKYFRERSDFRERPEF